MKPISYEIHRSIYDNILRKYIYNPKKEIAVLPNGIAQDTIPNCLYPNNKRIARNTALRDFKTSPNHMYGRRPYKTPFEWLRRSLNALY